MATAACLPIAADRAGPCVRNIFFEGLDLTGITLAAEMRLVPETPGPASISLGMGGSANAEGLRLVDVSTVDGIPVSHVVLRVNETTMEDAQKVPYAGELGSPSTLYYDLIGTFAQDKRRLCYGTFTALPTVYGMDAAPADRPQGYGAQVAPTDTWNSARLTFGDDRVTVKIDGADLLGGIVAEAQAALEAVRETVAPFASSYFERLYHRLWPEDFDFGPGEFVFVVGQIGHPGLGFMVPRTMTMRRGRQAPLIGDPIANVESSFRVGHSFVARTPGTAGVLWYDGRNGLVRFDTHADFLANLIDDPSGAFEAAYVLAVATANDEIISPTGIPWRRDNEQIGRNQAPWGRDVTKMSYRYGDASVVDVVDSTLLAYGFSKAVRGNTNRTTFLGDLLGSTYMTGGRVFFRVYAQSNEDNQFPDGCGVNIWGGPNVEGSPFVANRKLRLETILSPRARIYAGYIDFPPQAAIASFSIGFDAPASATATVAIAGVQFSADGAPRDIRRLDFTPAGPGLTLLIPDKIFIDPGRPLPLNVCNAVADMAQMADQVVTVSSLSSPANPTFTRTSADTIMLDPALLGDVAMINVQGRVCPGRWLRKQVAIVRTSTAAQTWLHIADSKSEAGVGQDIAAKAAARGKALTIIGTLPANRGEARGGWAPSDFTHEDPRFLMVEEANRKPGYDGNRPYNPLIVPGDGSYDPGIVQNGAAVDFRRYVTDFGFPDPTKLSFAVGPNEFAKGLTLQQVRDRITRSCFILHHQGRKAFPDADMAFWAWAMGYPRFTAGDYSYADLLAVCHQAQFDYVKAAGDPKLNFVALYLHQDRRADYDPSVPFTDGNGVQTAQSYNDLHEGAASRNLASEVGYNWLFS